MRLLSLPVPLLSLSLSLVLVLVLSPTASTTALTGRFVHLTDLHPDTNYLFNSSVEAACHSLEPTKGERAGWWGTPVRSVSVTPCCRCWGQSAI